ncbi:hypothetical protein [Burkholderia sp. MBR-1]|uniref:hypothetical protein n=1 Tax=Burkholderia sp. MBR-1 TaxID=2732364 RepID=UPI0015EE90EA|nr:hypothetical protein [Burkholderia sp. MBR-1]QMI49711.1 hypothetical protein MBR110_29995 [Burkholderia sp. MBR-1]
MKRLPKQTCFYCDVPATLLCDFKFGWQVGGYSRDKEGTQYAVAKIAPAYTCDIPLCRLHAESRGWLHIKARGNLGGFDTYDYCLEHAGQVDVGAGVIDEPEAERLRRAVRALAERRKMRARGVLSTPTQLPDQGELF